MEKPFVIIESPYSGDIEQNVIYAWDCVEDSIKRDEAPFASHLFYTEILDDENDNQRELGINLGLEIAKRADKTAVYLDKGMSRGMKLGIEAAKIAGREIEYRTLYGGLS